LDLGEHLLLKPGTVIPPEKVSVLALQGDDYEDAVEMFTRIGTVMLSARSVETCDMFISLASCLVRHANATSILLSTPSCSKFFEEQICHFLGCTTLVFQYIMVQGHSGNDLFQTFDKAGILVENVPLFFATPAIWSSST